MDSIYFGRGSRELYQDHIDFVNYVFGMNGTDRNIALLLPTQFAPNASPVENNFIALENGKLKATVGLYKNEISVCGQTLSVAGIGNVGVHPYERGKGYMKKLMQLAMEDMLASGTDFAVLGGQRQRYQYFSYEQAGACYHFHLTRANLRHSFHEKPVYTVQPLLETDTEALDAIEKLDKSSDFHALRSREKLYFILNSWQAKPYLIRDAEKVAGYFVLLGTEVTQLQIDGSEAVIPAIHAMMDYILSQEADFTINLPPFQCACIEFLETIANTAQIQHCRMFSVLQYQKVLAAFLNLKARFASLEDGEWSFLIHGIRCDECIRIQVANGQVSVTSQDFSHKYGCTELTHLEAMRFFFAPVCSARNSAPSFVRSWLPLPLWMYSPDCV